MAKEKYRFIEEYANQIKSEFEAIDKAIVDLTTRKSELEQGIASVSDPYQLEAVQKCTAQRTELAQVSEALNNAQTKRFEMVEAVSKEFAPKVGADWHTFVGLVNQEHKAELEAVYSASRALREALANAINIEKEARQYFSATYNGLRGYVSNKELNGTMYQFSLFSILRYNPGNLSDEKILKYLNKEAGTMQGFLTRE